MTTASQKWLKEADSLSARIGRLEHQAQSLRYQIGELSLEEDYARNAYRNAYNEELGSRRNHVKETYPRLSSPNPNPSAQWAVWRKHLDRITAHPKYKWEEAGTSGYRLLIKLSRFTMDMMGITNTQAWNPRNPNPHLP